MARERPTTLYFASSSQDKYEDYKFLLGKYADLRWSRLVVDEPLTMNLDILIRRKIEAVRPFLPFLPFVVEQTGLVISAWNNMPGNLTGKFMSAMGAEGICRMMNAYTGSREREAIAITDLGYHSADGQIQVFRGIVKGRIAVEPVGHGGFGWDPIFIPDGHDETFAQMNPEKKNSLSTRMMAVSDFYSSVLDQGNAEDVAQNRVMLRQLIIRHFNKSELIDLCFIMGIDPEEALPNDVKRNQVRELILFCDRHTSVDELLRACHNERPNVSWPDFT